MILSELDETDNRCHYVSGTSRGLGHGLAISLSNKVHADSVLLLIARNEQHLVELKNEIDAKKNDVKVIVKAIDLKVADFEAFKALIRSALEEAEKAVHQFDTTLIIHNAATLGTISKTTLDVDDINELRDYYEMNLFSAILLNSAFFNIFTKESVKKQLIVNVSSGAAERPHKSMNYYCTGKAAKEMFFKVLAAEFPAIRVLNYDPGTMKTDMLNEVIEGTADPELQQFLSKKKEEDELLDAEYSAETLILILEADKYKNGDHVCVNEPIA